MAVFMQLAPGLPWSRGPRCFKTSLRTHPEESQKNTKFQHNNAISETANRLINGMKWPWVWKARYGSERTVKLQLYFATRLSAAVQTPWASDVRKSWRATQRQCNILSDKWRLDDVCWMRSLCPLVGLHAVAPKWTTDNKSVSYSN